MSEVIATKDYENGVLIIEMNGKTNSFTVELLNTLEQWLDHALVDKQLHSIILTGTKSIFSVGGDLLAMKKGVRRGRSEDYVEKIVPKINKIIKKIMTHPLILIAAINGSAAGGGLSLALSCDYVISVSNAKFAFAFSSLDLTPDSGSTISFINSFGKRLALDAILTSRIILASEAYKIRAINEIVDADKLMPTALLYAAKMKKIDRDVISRTKLLIYNSQNSKLDRQLDMEYKFMVESSKSENFVNKLDGVLGMKKTYNTGG